MKKTICLLLTICLLCGFSVMYVGAETTATEIEFSQHVFSYCTTISTFRYTVIRSDRELEAMNLMFDTEDLSINQNEFCEFAKELPENYFDEKALVVVWHGSSGGTEYSIDNIVVDSENNLVELNCTYKEGSTLEARAYFIVAEVNQSDLPENEFFLRAKCKRSETANYQEVEFTQQVFSDGRIREDKLSEYLNIVNPSPLYGRNFRPVFALTLDEFNAFYADYESLSDSDKFVEFAEGLTEEYFEDNCLVLVYAQDDAIGYTYEVSSVFYNGIGVSLNYIHSSEPDSLSEGIKDNIIVVELKKSDVPDSTKAYASTVFMAHALDVTTETLPAHQIGDINGYDDVTTADYIMLKRMLLGAYDYSAESELEVKFIRHRADVNGDGDLGAADYILLKRFLLGHYEIVQ